VREIPLTKGYAALIDDMDYEFISRHPWCALVTGKNIKRVYAMRRETAANGKSLYILMHRQIMGPAPGIVVDHINHNTLDCQRSNLRLATRRQNLANGRKAIGISGYRGVSRANQKNGWSVIVDHAYHGTFQDKENAARHYDMIAKQVYGEFATLNFPESECGALRIHTERKSEMPLNLEPRSSADFISYLKFNGKAGRWYVKTDTGEEKEVLQLTAIFDLPNIKTGWIQFAEGAAPDAIWDNGDAIPPAPSPQHKRGFAVNVFSPKLLGGLREFSSTSNGAIIAIRELHDSFEQTYDPDKTMVPVVACESVTPVKSKFGTNYQPVLKIVKWVPRPQEMDKAPSPTAAGAAFDRDDIPLPPPQSAPRQAAMADEF
jgi:hypothetical protein